MRSGVKKSRSQESAGSGIGERVVNVFQDINYRELDFEVIETRRIHDQLNKKASFQDNNSIKGKHYNKRQWWTFLIQLRMVLSAIWFGKNVVLDSCNIDIKKRFVVMTLVKIFSFDTYWRVIVFINTDDEILMQRASCGDEKLVMEGGEEVWLENFRKQKKILVYPKEWEANFLYEIRRDNDKKDVFQKIRYLV